MAKALWREAQWAQYTLRSSFFYRQYSRWLALVKATELASSAHLSWGDRRGLGISDVAWNKVQKAGVAPAQVFCYPVVIIQQPTTIAYYRIIALLPQKGLQKLAGSTKALEEGSSIRLSQAKATQIAYTLNSLISLQIESDPNWTLGGSRIAGLLNLGTQVNGSWRNEIGAEGSRRVKELLVGTFMQWAAVKHFVLLDGTEVTTGQDIPPMSDLRAFTTVSGYQVIFGSEPDVSVRDQPGTLQATIEVKYGLDEAGALERYGAAKKSFEQATRENRQVINVYLAACITAEVRHRINDDRLVSKEFDLTETLGDSGKRAEFLAYLRWLLHL